MRSPGPPAGAWECLAVRHGGTVADLAAARAADGETIFAATPAGVFRSTDAGRSWTPAGPVGGLPFVTCVATSPTFARDRTVFAGTWGGLFRSRDGGGSWQPVLAGGSVLALAVSPAFADDGTVFVGTAEDGILRSEDGGDRWLSANAGLLDLAVTTLVLSARFSDDGTAFAGTASGLYRSRNGGRSWQEVDLGLDEVGVQAIGLGPHRPGGGWIAVGTEQDGLLLSDDGGTTWLDVPELEGPGIGQILLRADGDGSVVLLVAMDRSVLRSDDEGASWCRVAVLSARVLTLLSVDGLGEDGPAETLAGLVGDGVVRISATDGPPMPANEGLDATPLSMLAVSPDVAVDGTLFVASADGTVLVSHDRGRTLDRIGFDVDASAITGLSISSRFRHDATVWASVPDALLRSRDGGRTWEPMPVDPPDDLLDAVPDESAVRLLTVGRDGDRDVLFLAIGPIVGRSDDGGERWHWLGAIDDAAEVVGLVGRSDQGGGCLYAATGSGSTPGQVGQRTIWRSGDGGQAWEPWLEVEGDGPPVLLSWDGPPSEPNLLVAAGSTVYLPRADARERRGRSTRPLWRPIELGQGVSRISSLATPTGPQAGRTIYAGTDQGVFVSRDGGLSFGPWGGDPGPTAFLAVAVAPDYASSREVFAVGHGGALWHRRDQ